MTSLLTDPETETSLAKIYNGIDGYAISERIKNQLTEHDDSLTYGEITIPAMKKILGELALPPGQIFFDLGSGTGKVVILAALLGNFSEVWGVELIDDLYNAAELARKRFVIELESNFTNLPRPKINFLNDDLFTVDFSAANVVFVASTCFTDIMMNSLRSRLTMLARGSLVLTMTRTLQSPYFELVRAFSAPMNWGNATIFLYKKLR